MTSTQVATVSFSFLAVEVLSQPVLVILNPSMRQWRLQFPTNSITGQNRAPAKEPGGLSSAFCNETGGSKHS